MPAHYAAVVYLQPSTKATKKYMVTLYDDTSGMRAKTLHFGAASYSDYTKHHDATRMRLYLNRHKAREDWSKAGIDTPGFWARWLLWSHPSLKDAISATEGRFGLEIRRRKAPQYLRNFNKTRMTS